MWCASAKNPLCGSSFASCAIRCCFVDTGSGSEAPAMFPSNGSMIRHPLPSTGSAGSVPPLPRYYGVLRFPTARPVPLRFLRETVTAARVWVRVSGQARRRLGAWGVRVRPPLLPVVVEAETVGRPKFLGNPGVPLPCSQTPAGPLPQAITLRRHGPRAFNYEGSQREVISGLKRTALALAVYAWPAGSPRRTQDWLLVAGQALPGGIRTRRVPAKGFQGVVVTSYPPFPSLLGAMNVPFFFPGTILLAARIHRQ